MSRSGYIMKVAFYYILNELISSVLTGCHIQQVALTVATHGDCNNRGLQGTFLTIDATQAPRRGNIKAYQVYPTGATEMLCWEWMEMARAGLANQGDNCHKLLPCGRACQPYWIQGAAGMDLRETIGQRKQPHKQLNCCRTSSPINEDCIRQRGISDHMKTSHIDDCQLLSFLILAQYL